MPNNQFWDIEEVQQIFDEATEAVIKRSELEEVGDRLKANGYKLFKLKELQKATAFAIDLPQPRFFELVDPLVRCAIATLTEAIDNGSPSERRVQISLEVLQIVFKQ